MVAKSPSSAAPAGSSSRSSCRVWGIVIVLAVIIAFGRLASSEFLEWDDRQNLYENHRLNPPTWSGVAHYWSHTAFGLYIPLTYSVWGALAALTNLEPDAQGISMNPWVFHGFNVLLHVGGALVCFTILARFFSCAPAAVGALVFALHPVQVESVGWAAGMKDVLAGLLALVALWQYSEATRGWGRAGESIAGVSDAPQFDDWLPLPPSVHHAIALAAFVLAMLAKPSAMVVPALALVIDIWLLRRRPADSLRALSPWFALSLACSVVARIAQDTSVVDPAPLWARPFIAADALAFYLFKLLGPLHLSIDYGRSHQYVRDQWWFYVTWLAPAAIMLALWLNRKRRPELFAAAAIFVLAVSPVLGLFTFQFQYFSTVADHYLYLAMLGPGLAAAWLASGASHRFGRVPVVACCAVILMALGARSALQAGVWRNNRTLFTHTLRVNERSFLAYGVLGLLALQENDPARAEERFRRAVRLNPRYTPVLSNLGHALELQGRYEQAAEAQATALAIELRQQADETRPHTARLAAALAFNLARLHRYDEAIARLRLAIELAPDDPELLGWLEEIERRAARAASTRAAPTTTTPATNPP